MNTLTNKEYHKLDQQNYLPTFIRFPVTFAKAKGCSIWDVEGREYLDVLSGISVNNLGHCHPKVVQAIQQQAEKLMHISNFYLSVPQAELSQKLIDLSGLNHAFFTNSGAESVEGAIKIARKYAHSKGRGGDILYFEGSFHGRTMATIAMGKKAMQKGFAPIPTGFSQLPFNEEAALRQAVNSNVAAIIIEPVQGEGGIRIADDSFLRSLRQVCDENDVLLIFDEIQSGMGRTGKMFAKEHSGVQPDIMTLAKALGGGVPLGAVLCNTKAGSAIQAGDHGTTFGGNPLVCAAALAVIQEISDSGLLQQSQEKGVWIKNKIASWKEDSITEIRGRGLMIGIEFEFETKALVQKMFEKSVLANATGGNVLRLLPPLNITYEQLEKLLEVMKLSLKEIKQHA